MTLPSDLHASSLPMVAWLCMTGGDAACTGCGNDGAAGRGRR